SARTRARDARVRRGRALRARLPLRHVRPRAPGRRPPPRRLGSRAMRSSRREFLRTTAAAGAALSTLRVPIRALAATPLGAAARFAPNQWVRIDASGRMTVVVARSEMGLGVRTSLA